MSAKTVQETLRTLVDHQRFGVLATQAAGQPYASLVAFAATPELSSLLFATPRGTRKYTNIRSNPRVAVLIDSRSNTAADIQEAVAATATGVCREVTATEHAVAAAFYLTKHPHLETFVRDENTALLCVDIDAYVVVDRFQHVVEWRPGS